MVVMVVSGLGSRHKKLPHVPLYTFPPLDSPARLQAHEIREADLENFKF